MKIKTCFFFFLIMPWLFLGTLAHGKSLKINIIGHSGGKGLILDKTILSQGLKSLGCKVSILEGFEESVPNAHINIFIEHISPHMLKKGELNWFIPNPEWYCASKEVFDTLDLILCRTKEIERIFKKKGKKTYYLSFTSPDAKISGIAKDFNSWVHIAGNSPQKGTGAVTRTWLKNKNFPHTTIIRWTPSVLKDAKISNLTWLSTHQPYENVRLLQNQSGIHLCVSETEGFGHYLMEAMSCEAVILTTDAPPMNEFITDKRCLVPYESKSKQRLAMNYYVSDHDLEVFVKGLLNLSEDELMAIGKANRANYLRIKENFYIRLKKLMDSVDR